jgi:hypothetical protein
MIGQCRNLKHIILQIFVMIALVLGTAEAKGIETGLWGLGWDANPNQAKQALEGQGFVLLDQGNDGAGISWIKFGNGQYTGFPCEVKVIWQAGQLAEISIESTEEFLLGSDLTYRNLSARFSEQYGPPRQSEAYMLKIFPGVWVEWSSWTVALKDVPTYAVKLEQNKPAEKLAGEPTRQEKIIVLFQKITTQSR